jgi:hypothetical protein
MQKQAKAAIWAEYNANAYAYIRIGGDGFFNAYVKCDCAKSPRYKHFFDMQKAITWASGHLAKHS